MNVVYELTLEVEPITFVHATLPDTLVDEAYFVGGHGFVDMTIRQSTADLKSAIARAAKILGRYGVRVLAGRNTPEEHPFYDTIERGQEFIQLYPANRRIRGTY